MCLSEIPLDLQDTQLSPKAIAPGLPVCLFLISLTVCSYFYPSSPCARGSHAISGMCILHSLGDYSSTSLCSLYWAPSPPPPAAGTSSRQAPGVLLGLCCMKSKDIMKMSCNPIRREGWQRSPGLWQAAPSSTPAQGLPVSKQAHTPGPSTAVPEAVPAPCTVRCEASSNF